MDQSDLRRLGTQGLHGAAETREAAAWCWDWSEATGDGRYCVLARALERIALEWDEGMFRAETVDDINDVLAEYVAGILDAASAEEGAALARPLKENVQLILGRQ